MESSSVTPALIGDLMSIRECFKEVLPANKNNEFRYKTSCIENV